MNGERLKWLLFLPLVDAKEEAYARERRREGEETALEEEEEGEHADDADASRRAAASRAAEARFGFISFVTVKGA